MDINGEDYISLTDMLKNKDGDFFVTDWLRNRNTLEFLGVWEGLYNPAFNYGEFAIIKSSAGLNNFKVSVKEWAERTNAKGIISTAGRYGGTYAHRDIAFEFGTWINATFKLYLIKEYQRLKDIETNQYNLEWNVRRVLSKVNYQIHTDAVQGHVVPKIHWNKGLFYADEADLLNTVLFGQTAKEWRDTNSERAKQGENIRDSASINELTILSNLESYNAELIKKKLEKKQRFDLLQEMAQSQAIALNNNMHNKFTLGQFQTRFPNNDVCLEEIKQLRFGDNPDCPKCLRPNHFYRVKGRSAYACSFCGHHLYPLKSSIFDHSSTPLTLWFYAIYLMAQTRSGMSAKQLERMLGVTYKTAWRMFKQIRQLMADDGMPLFGEVEVDETYFHADPRKNKRVHVVSGNGKRHYDSQVIFGMVERGGRAKVMHVPTSGSRSLIPQIEHHILNATHIYSDEARVYGKLAMIGYLHDAVKHKNGEYVQGNVHTQNIENLWSYAKRGIKGVYRHVSPKYLRHYVDEYAFRKQPGQMFDLILMNVARSDVAQS